MNHSTACSFWDAYYKMSKNVQVLSKTKFELLKINPHHYILKKFIIYGLLELV